MKNWYKSKTIRTNAIVVIGAITQFLPQLQVTMTVKQYAIAFFLFGVANLVLRKVTTTAIK
jgi:hypothetical protein